MCRAVTCRTCNKTTWAGCGQHVATVRAGVPAAQWCNGTHTSAQLKAAEEAKAARRGLLGRLLGR